MAKKAAKPHKGMGFKAAVAMGSKSPKAAAMSPEHRQRYVAGGIANRARKASAAAKRANPNLKKVGGIKKKGK